MAFCITQSEHSEKKPLLNPCLYYFFSSALRGVDLLDVQSHDMEAVLDVHHGWWMTKRKQHWDGIPHSSHIHLYCLYFIQTFKAHFWVADWLVQYTLYTYPNRDQLGIGYKLNLKQLSGPAAALCRAWSFGHRAEANKKKEGSRAHRSGEQKTVISIGNST